MKGALRIAHLYPRDMNIYGDDGNVLTLVRRLEWRGFDVEVLEINRGDALPRGADIIVGGGGQDSGQVRVESDLQRLGPDLRAMAEDGVPMLLVCGLYQLFGHRFSPAEGRSLRGIGVLDVDTTAGRRRLIGNVVAQSSRFGEVIGYENHSGRTTLGEDLTPFARVGAGMGNNGTDGSEGARRWNVLGTYLHGSLLPKNPAVADDLLARTVERRFGSRELLPLDDAWAAEARRVARSRPR